MGLFLTGCPCGKPPTASFTASPAGGPAPLTVSFTDTSAANGAPIKTWVWDFGDGGSSAVQHPSHTYTVAGTYAVSLTVKNAAGSGTTGAPQNISVTNGASPAASFTATPTEGPAPLTVSFTDTSTAGSFPITSWAWDFGDGGTSAVQHPSHTYTAAGTYAVSLSLTTADGGGTASEPQSINVINGAEGEGEGEGETVGSLHVTIVPPEAVTAGAVWTLDHGFNHESGETVGNVATGPHTVSFKDLGAGWTTPAEQTVTVTAGQPAEATGRYTPAHAAGDEQTFAGIAFKWIPPGSFQMGTLRTSAELTALYGDSGVYFDPEHPRHPVTITQGFWLGKYEVTQAQWSARMSDNPSANTGQPLPVERVSWDDCQAFIVQLNLLGQGVFRLPTEAEWEYACRAGTETEFYWGDDAGVSNDYAWHCLDAAHCSTQPVGQLTPNAWGLYDMSGNVMEWCHDRYDPAYYTTDAIVNPQGPEPPATGYVSRVRRGGATADLHDIAFCRSAMRYHNIQGFSQADTGFRLVRESND
jgi:PKD repeat protein